jgi:uncharacterized protein YkwD
MYFKDKDPSFDINKFVSAGENVGGYERPGQAVEGWMMGPRHRDAIMANLPIQTYNRDIGFAAVRNGDNFESVMNFVNTWR